MRRLGLLLLAAGLAIGAGGCGSHKTNDIEAIIQEQLGQDVSACFEQYTTAKFNCTKDGAPNCYVFEVNSVDEAFELEEGRAYYSDYKVEDFGPPPPGSPGC